MTELKERPGGVQSIARAFTVLETLAHNGGIMGLSHLAAEAGLPLPTMHRLVRTLVDLGYLRQEPSRKYAFGPRLLLLADCASTMLSTLARPHLSRLVNELGESANLAMLDGDELVYVAQVPSKQSMRMFTEVGFRVLPHCTAVGKAVLMRMDPKHVQALLERTGMPSHTDKTIVDAASFLQELVTSARRGYCVDDGEREVGVRCVAVAVPDETGRLAISVSGPATRMTDDTIRRAVPVIEKVAHALADDLDVRARVLAAPAGTG